MFSLFGKDHFLRRICRMVCCEESPMKNSIATTLPARVNYAEWFWRVASWDGILPLLMLAVSPVIRMTLPRLDDRFVMGFNVSLMVIAFFIRLATAAIFIASNRCSDRLRHWQQLSLVFGLYGLMFFECFYFAATLHGVSNGNRFSNSIGDWIAISFPFWAIYLPCLTFAMYPGCESVLGNPVTVDLRKAKC
jgi:hypothetical protein